MTTELRKERIIRLCTQGYNFPHLQPLCLSADTNGKRQGYSSVTEHTVAQPWHCLQQHPPFIPLPSWKESLEIRFYSLQEATIATTVLFHS